MLAPHSLLEASPPGTVSLVWSQRSRYNAGVSHLDDVQLVAKLCAGDQDALGALYDRHASMMLAVGVQVLKDRQESEDLLHEVFLEAWRTAKSYNPRRGNVRTWLFMKMRSRAIDRWRKRSRVQVMEPQLIEESAVIQEERPDHQKAGALMNSLPEPQRVVLERSFFFGLTPKEIGEELNIPVGTVKSRIARGLEALRRQVKEGRAQYD